MYIFSFAHSTILLFLFLLTLSLFAWVFLKKQDAMLAAAPYELPNLVSQSLKAVSSPSFFMAIAV